MDAQERSEFVTNYTRLLTTSWSNDEFAQLLDDDPKSALSQVGLNVSSGSQVVLVRIIPTVGSHEPSLDRQIELWERGQSTGLYEMHVPKTPQIATQELSEGDLMAVSAGDSCCCTPCCCCT